MKFDQTHLNDVGETYFEHMINAWKYAFKLLCATIALFLHGIFPNIFINTASDTMKKIIAEVHHRKETKK